MGQLGFSRLIGWTDQQRARVLKLCLARPETRSLYSNPPQRIFVSGIFSLLFYLPIAFYFPELLMILGPLLLGYPHIAASFRFVDKTKFHFFILLSMIAAFLHYLDLGFGNYAKVPFGTWQIIVATLGLVASKLSSPKWNWIELVYGFSVASILMFCAWLDPIMFIGGFLILHNWVAYFTWISRTKSDHRFVAILSSLIFLLIHVIILSGLCDQLIPHNGNEIMLGSEGSSTGWYLASWSNNPIVWYRFLVLYVFGLSMHYFVWLKAIPESEGQSVHPMSFRRSIAMFTEDVGKIPAIIILLVALTGMVIWIGIPKLGAQIYYEIAILHGYIEILFFFSARSAGTKNSLGSKQKFLSVFFRNDESL